MARTWGLAGEKIICTIILLDFVGRLKFEKKFFPPVFLRYIYKQLGNFIPYDLGQIVIVMQHLLECMKTLLSKSIIIVDELDE